MTDEEKTIAELRQALNGFLEMKNEQFRRNEQERRIFFFGAIPEEARVFYIHLSHFINDNHLYVRKIKEIYGIDNVLVTVAPAESYQSFYDNHLDKSAEEKKRKMVTEPFDDFAAKKSIDAIIYLCNHPCDGYVDPYFPDQIQTAWHIWKAIEPAERLQKPLTVGYGCCEGCHSGTMGVECHEREYITGFTRGNLASRTKGRITVPTKIVRL